MNATARLLRDLADNADLNRRTTRNVTILFALLFAIEAQSGSWQAAPHLVIVIVCAFWWRDQARLVNRCKTEGLYR